MRAACSADSLIKELPFRRLRVGFQRFALGVPESREFEAGVLTKQRTWKHSHAVGE